MLLQVILLVVHLILLEIQDKKNLFGMEEDLIHRKKGKKDLFGLMENG